MNEDEITTRILAVQEQFEGIPPDEVMALVASSFLLYLQGLGLSARDNYIARKVLMEAVLPLDTIVKSTHH